jgi:NAD(P)-dependent dehydrogenase (short-subunit alcohol dehydrogenase family)
VRGWALITGGARRLGRASALALAEAGYDIVVHYNGSSADADETCRDIKACGRSAISVQGNLSDAQSASGLVAAAGRPLTALINCAAIFEHDDITTLGPDALERHMAINARAPVLLIQAFASALLADQRGVVVNFLDFKLASPYPDHLSYTLSKYALMGATEVLARALAPRIRVNAVAPGYTLPSPGQPDADFQRLHAKTPLAYGATAQDVGAAVAYLATSPAVTGQTIYVDSGLRMISHETDFSFR